MSIRLIYGKSGSGKSDFIFKEINEEIRLEKKVYIITPEQFSYVTEKKLLENLASSSSIKCEVISFNRIAHRVQIEVGGITKTNLSESGRAMLVHSILTEQQKQLKFLGNSSENVELILNTITELKRHNINLENLENSKHNLENVYLKMKIEEIYNIYNTYQNSILDKFIDEDDKLTVLSKTLDNSKMFNGADVYIDEFAGFTEIEYEIIKEILKKAKRVSITVCADKIETSTNPETDIFYANKQTANKLLKLSNELDVKPERPVILDKQYRFKNDELIHMEKNIYINPYDKYNKEVKNIKLFIEANPYSEIENIAKQIVRFS